MIELIFVLVASYLLGAFPSGQVIARLRGVDLRSYGSGKTGTANVLRTLGYRAAVMTFAADFIKGILAVLLARFILSSPTAEVGAAFAAVAGHNWPIYLRFRGGRGVTPALGALFAMVLLVGSLGLAVGLATIGLSRYVSLGSILGAVTVIVGAIAFAALDRMALPYLVYALLGASLILFEHRDNMARLWNGTERRIGQRAEKRD